MSTNGRAEVVIAGGGVAALVLAVTLARRLGRAFTVALHDPALASRAQDPNIRAYAISAFGRRQFEDLGIWSELANSAQPISRMIVTDSSSEELVRPIFLQFDGEIAPGEPFAHMIGEASMLASLHAAAHKNGVVLSDTAVIHSASSEGARRRIRLSDGREIAASLLVAADGRRSRLREAAGIPFYGWDYGQNGIVVPVRHERGHGGCAEEHFLPAGPFAVLPMRAGDGGDTEASIVWTEERGRAERLCALGISRFNEALQEKFGAHLGTVRALAEPETYPLALGLARRFYDDRLALLGDAAHVIHPLAGQGLNLGVQDAAALGELIIADACAGLDIGAPSLLERFDRARRFDTAAMAVMTDGLNRLFSNNAAPLRALRDLGLGLVDRAPALKRFLIAEAAGVGTSTQRRIAR